MHTTPRVAAIVMALGLSAWLPPWQSTDATPPARPAQVQGDRPVFRGGVELMQLDVSVLDRKRQPVTGLNASDFTVLENGVERPVRAFSSVQLPARASSAGAALPAEVPSDVVTNQVGQQEGRLILIVMDRSIPTGQPTMAARRIALAAVDALGPHDLAALVSTSGAVPQNLTGNRALLIRAINERRDWSTGPSPEQKSVMMIPDDPLSDGRCLCGLCVLETLTRMADAVQNTPLRRKTVIFIGSSVIFQAGVRAPSLDVGCDYRVKDARQRLFDSLALSNLTVHSIDPSGLYSLGPQTRAGSIGGRQGENGPAVRLQQMQTETSALLQDQESLHVLPDLTGGRAVSNTNVPEQRVPEIVGETDAYYVLGFESATSDQRADKRSIEVKVARAGVSVHAQRQYIAPAVEKAPVVTSPVSERPVSLAKALLGLLPNASRPLSLSLAAFAGSGAAKAIVTVNADVGGFANAGDVSRPLEFAVLAVDQRNGRQVAFSRETAAISFAPATPNRRAEGNVQTHIELPPGDYEVRIAVSDPAIGIAASVFGPITVPPFGSAHLSLSDVIVETAGATTTRRMFNSNEPVRALVQVYQGTQRSDSIVPVSVRTGIVDANGRSMRDQLLALSAKDFTNRRAALALDVGQLPRGDYVLTIDASVDRQKTARTLHFSVE